jgi:hypothetical protein
MADYEMCYDRDTNSASMRLLNSVSYGDKSPNLKTIQHHPLLCDLLKV